MRANVAVLTGASPEVFSNECLRGAKYNAKMCCPFKWSITKGGL